MELEFAFIEDENDIMNLEENLIKYIKISRRKIDIILSKDDITI